jgi:hypothetical protein
MSWECFQTTVTCTIISWVSLSYGGSFIMFTLSVINNDRGGFGWSLVRINTRKVH